MLAFASSQRRCGPGPLHRHFVNPITDICWSCLFPISIGG
jgi:conjugal transfer pilus assembly protein TraU